MMGILKTFSPALRTVVIITVITVDKRWIAAVEDTISVKVKVIYV